MAREARGPKEGDFVTIKSYKHDGSCIELGAIQWYLKQVKMPSSVAMTTR